MPDESTIRDTLLPAPAPLATQTGEGARRPSKSAVGATRRDAGFSQARHKDAGGPIAQALPLWKTRDYMLLWSGQVVSTLGSTATSIVFPLLILALTNSPAAAGLASALRAAPYFIFSLPVGALIDRWDRKRVMINCDVGRAIAVLTVPVALWLDALTIWQIYLVAFIEGSLFVFFNIAEVAALPRVVPVAQLPQAAAQNEAAFGAVHIAGPSIGTFLYQTLGKGAPFIADAISYVMSVVSLLLIKTEFRLAKAVPSGPLQAEIVEGLRWLWRKPLIRYMAFLTGGLNLVNAAVPLIVIVLAKQMGAGDVEIGLIFSIGGIGGVVGSLVGGPIKRDSRSVKSSSLSSGLRLFCFRSTPWSRNSFYSGRFML